MNANTIREITSFFPFGAQRGYISLDIGSSAIKLLEVRPHGSKITVTNAGVVPLPQNAVSDNLVEDTGAVTQAIGTFLEDHRIRATNAVIAMPGPSVIVKRVALPSQEPEALEETVFLEAGNFIPERLDDVNLDYQVLDHDTQSDLLDVLLVAVRKDAVQSYLTAVRDAGLVPTIVDVDYFAMENMFEANYDPDPADVVALVNVGARYTSINLLQRGFSIFTGDVPLGGNHFTLRLSQELGVDSVQAEDAKRSGRLTGFSSDVVERALSVTSEQLLDEIQRTLQFFQSGAQGQPPGSVYLSGGTAGLPGLTDRFADRLRVPVAIADPFRNLDKGRRLDADFVAEYAPAFAVSVGLATRRVGDK